MDNDLQADKYRLRDWNGGYRRLRASQTAQPFAPEPQKEVPEVSVGEVASSPSLFDACDASDWVGLGAIGVVLFVLWALCEVVR